MQRRWRLLYLTILPAVIVLVLLTWWTKAEVATFTETEMGAMKQSTLNPAQETRPGSERYTPTRLEWLALELNATGRRSQTHGHKFSLMYVPLHGEDAIGVYVGHEADVDREQMNKAIDHARDIVIDTAKVYGWHKWVQVIEVVRQDADEADNRTSSG